jgi:hypothetical protein
MSFVGGLIGGTLTNAATNYKMLNDFGKITREDALR